MLNGRDAASPSDSRPGDDEFLAALRDRIGQLAPAVVEQCQIRDGLMVGLPDWSVMMLPNHTGSPAHFDIGFNAALESGSGGVVVDCLSGTGSMPDSVARVQAIWLETSGACFLELLTMNGKFATHLYGSGPDGIPGWHTVVSPVTGYSYGSGGLAGAALAEAMAGYTVLNRLAGRLLPLLTRPANNGIKVFYFRKPGSAIAEIRVNGVADADASQALADLDWPEVTEPAIVRCYAVATHRV